MLNTRRRIALDGDAILSAGLGLVGAIVLGFGVLSWAAEEYDLGASHCGTSFALQNCAGVSTKLSIIYAAIAVGAAFAVLGFVITYRRPPN